jgi:hypothetical protein
LADSETLAEDAGGLFIQCDICKVWQHGGCVGIMDEAASPEEYFCEECRKDLHKLMMSPKGYVELHFVSRSFGGFCDIMEGDRSSVARRRSHPPRPSPATWEPAQSSLCCMNYSPSLRNPELLLTSWTHRQRYSRYLPVFEYANSKSSKKRSVSKDVEPKGSRENQKSSRASAESFTKRRSTMNSRAAWDEDEVLRKVLEASKGEGSVEGGSTRKKRSRDDSEE